jgi:sporulation protein YlmC with PRC-barrel domain
MISSSDVKNVSIYNMQGKSIGSIDHLMIGKRDGRIRYGVISFGGFLGLGHSHYPIPWNAFGYNTTLGGYETQISEQQLRDAPEFSDDSFTSPEWERKIHTHYGVDGYSAVPSAGATQTTATASSDSEIVSSEDVEGLEVYDQGGRDIGSVDHLMIEKRTGQVRYAVISFGGFLGLGRSHHPIPWDSLDYDGSLQGFRTTISEDQLRAAPDYTDESWQRREYEDELRQHYSRRV